MFLGTIHSSHFPSAQTYTVVKWRKCYLSPNAISLHIWGNWDLEKNSDLSRVTGNIKDRSYNKDLLYSTGNSTQYSVMIYMGKESKKEWKYVYAWLIHFAVQQKVTQHCKSTGLQLKKKRQKLKCPTSSLISVIGMKNYRQRAAFLNQEYILPSIIKLSLIINILIFLESQLLKTCMWNAKCPQR